MQNIPIKNPYNYRFQFKEKYNSEFLLKYNDDESYNELCFCAWTAHAQQTQSGSSYLVIVIVIFQNLSNISWENLIPVLYWATKAFEFDRREF